MNKNSFISAAVAAISILTGCAKEGSVSGNTAAQKQLTAWMQLHYPDATQTELGTYIIEDEEGTGELLGDIYTHPFFSMRFTARDLDGNISESTEEVIAKQLGSYNSSYYYGPITADRYTTSDDDEFAITAGMDDAISTMRVGGRRKVIIPGWLMTFARFSGASGYLDNASGTNMMYDIEITDAIYDLFQYQVDSIETYMERNLEKVDSTINGLYYVQHVAPEDTTGYESGEIVYVNYIGRLLNGQVFDTTIKDTAKVYGIYDPDTDYEPMGIKLASDYTENSMASSSSSTFIEGFSYCISQMRKGEVGTTVFYSTLGYGESASGNIIPAYSPLRFDIEFLGPDEDDEE